MREISFVPTTEYGGRAFAPAVPVFLADALHMLAVSELLLISFFRLIQDAFPAWAMDSDGVRRVQLFLVATILLFGVLVPITGRFRPVACVALELGYFALGGWYAYRHTEELRGGLTAVYSDYLKAWNAYYQTNYSVHGGEWELAPHALCFTVLVILLLLLLLCYASGRRWPLLLMPLSALALGFLVDVPSGWNGLAWLFMGIAVICAGPQESARFHVISARGMAAWRLGALARNVLLVLLILWFTPWVFGDTVAQIPEKAPEIMAFQKDLEDGIAGLGNRLTATDKVSVDNSTPRYRDKLILEVTADVRPDSNLYLADFYSGTYQGGSWLQNPWEYRNAAREDGIDRDRLGALLRQMPYESSRQSGPDGQWLTHYRIDYRTNTNCALVPYFSNVAGIDDVWVVDEGLVRKSRSQKALEFAGSTAWSFVSNPGDGADAAVWYSAYAAEHYVKESGIPAAEKQARLTMNGPLGSWSQHSEGTLRASSYSDPVNTRRLMLADTVRRRLAELAVYDLYLDKLPEGADVVQYFLETGHRGYCMHFASAGTLILQEMGVPARYASGYIVKQQAFQEDADTGEFVAPVYDRNGHAWVEIYMENVGWIPWEMTPGYETLEEVLPTDEGNQERLQEENSQKSSSETESQDAGIGSETELMTETEPLPGNSASNASDQGDHAPGGQTPSDTAADRLGKLAFRVAVAAVALLALLLLIRLGVVLGMRHYHALLGREVRKKQHRRAVRRINRRIYRRLPKGLSRGRMTDAEYEKKLADTYHKVTPEDWKRYMQVVKKVAFSREEVSDEEMRLCLTVYRTR